jgi:formylmethanofuran dehydrogenase subunit C
MTLAVTLSLKQTPPVPVEAESLNPENVAGKDEREIGLLPLLVGKQWETVASWFHVAVAAAPADDGHEPDGCADLVLRGDLTRFKRLGEGMSRGRMIVEGPVGFHAGARMSGGSLTIHGDAADFLGAHMTGGRIVVRGNAGHYTAAAYRGHKQGMAGGTIIITGSAGQMLGARMRRGLIYVLGDSGDVTGFNMKAGTIIVGGTPGVRVGARMVRGSILLLGGDTALLPTFSYDCTYQPGFWALLHKHLAGQGFAPEAGPATDFTHYSGDANEGGRGEVLVRVRRS